jgi:hypothetical protein
MHRLMLTLFERLDADWGIEDCFQFAWLGSGKVGEECPIRLYDPDFSSQGNGGHFSNNVLWDQGVENKAKKGNCR